MSQSNKFARIQRHIVAELNFAFNVIKRGNKDNFGCDIKIILIFKQKQMYTKVMKMFITSYWTRSIYRKKSIDLHGVIVASLT